MPETIATPAVGTRIADIPLLDEVGRRSRLWEEIDGNPAVLFFMRAADCPVCLAHTRTLGKMILSGDLTGTRVIVIAPGDAEEARKAQGRIALSAIAVRASGDHHADVGLGKFLALQHSGTFVLDADGVVLSAMTSAVPTASFSKAKVLAVLGR